MSTNKWQPISTAPKDGQRMLLTGIGMYVIGEWVDWEDEFGKVSRWETVGGFELHPTHWMPLPDPPEEAKL